MSIQIYKVLISVCLFVRSKLINALTDLPQILIGELRRTIRMFLVEFKDSKFSRFNFLGKAPFPVKAGFPSKFSLVWFV